MKDIELWFTRYQGNLYVAWCPPNEDPRPVRRVTSVGSVFKTVKTQGYGIIQVGIVPPDALGLE